MPTFPFTVSARPTLTVDERAGRVIEPVAPNGTYPGMPLAFGLMRMATCLPTNGAGPVMVVEPLVLGDGQSYLGDPSGTFVGEHGPEYIHRLLSARWTENTRRLGG
jgi:hypothetical protein